MINNQKIEARLAAVLFVATMLLGMVDAYLAGPVLRGPLEAIRNQETAVLTGALMRLCMSIGVVGIALAFLPVIRLHSERIGLLYLVFRTAECVLLCLGICAHIFLIDLSHSYGQGGAPESAVFLVMAQGALSFSRITYQIAMAILGVGSVLLCWVLLRARLIPAWIAWLGLIGYVLLLASALLDLLRIVDTIEGIGATLYIPGGVFEFIVLPVWLWIRGFNTNAHTKLAGAQRSGVTVIACVIIGMCFFQPTNLHAEEEWKVLKQLEGEREKAWVLYSRNKPGSGFIEYRIVGVVGASPKAALTVAKKILVDPTYLPKGVQRTVLRDEGGIIISHTRFSLPGPFSDRDVVLRINKYRTLSGVIGLRWIGVPESDPPVAKGVVRMPQSSGYWEFTPIEDGGTVATCVLHGDLGGQIPAWIVNRMAGNSLIDDLGHIRRITAKEREEVK